MEIDYEICLKEGEITDRIASEFLCFLCIEIAYKQMVAYGTFPELLCITKLKVQEEEEISVQEFIFITVCIDDKRFKLQDF